MKSTRRIVAALCVGLTVGMLPGGAATAEDAHRHNATESYPWMATLQFVRHPRTGEPGFHTCGAVVIARDALLTAAHCVSERQPDGSFRARLAHDLQVRVGSVDRAEGGELHQLRDVVIHPDWRFASGADLAIVHTVSPMRVQPISISPTDPGRLPTAQRRVLGWGVPDSAATPPNPGDSSKNPRVLHEEDTGLLPDAQCLPGTPVGVVPGEELCIGMAPTGVSGVCFGDSGGPVIRRTPGRNEWVLEGAASRGIAEPKCGVAPSVFTNATHFRPWIQTVR